MSKPTIEVSLSCRDLPFLDAGAVLGKRKSSAAKEKGEKANLDAPSLSKVASVAAGGHGKQSQAVIFLQDAVSGQWAELHTTDLVKNTTNPTYKPFQMEYKFECHQPVKIEIVIEAGGPSIGSVELTVAELVTGGASQEYPIMNKEKQVATLTASVEEMGGNDNSNVTLNMRAIKLDAKDAFGKSDPFVVISRGTEGGGWVQVHKTEWIKQNLNPTWHPVQIPMDKLNTGDKFRQLKFEVFDYDKGGKAEYIGDYVATYNDLVTRSGQPQALMNNKKKVPKKSGDLVIEVSSVPRPSFLSYVSAQFPIDMMLCVDYTASNEPHTQSHSLHFLSAKHQNQYQRVLTSVADILLPYVENTFMFGFGAKVLPTKKTSHCFSLNFGGELDTGKVESTKESILRTYGQSFDHVNFHGPTYFVPLLTKAQEIATGYQAEGANRYLFVLIITDGEMDDLSAACKLLKDICILPMSIVIVGVGNNPFQSMEALDDDEGELGCTRDIVQFIPFSKVDPADLAEEMLEEIPVQYVDYMMDHKINPEAPGKAPKAAAPKEEKGKEEKGKGGKGGKDEKPSKSSSKKDEKGGKDKKSSKSSSKKDDKGGKSKSSSKKDTTK